MTRRDPTIDHDPDPTLSGVLEFVLERFPERSEQIELAYVRRPTFREICTDYYAVAQALTACDAAADGDTQSTAAEMRTLMDDLARELVRALDHRVAPNAAEVSPTGCLDTDHPVAPSGETTEGAP